MCLLKLSVLLFRGRSLDFTFFLPLILPVDGEAGEDLAAVGGSGTVLAYRSRVPVSGKIAVVGDPLLMRKTGLILLISRRHSGITLSATNDVGSRCLRFGQLRRCWIRLGFARKALAIRGFALMAHFVGKDKRAKVRRNRIDNVGRHLSWEYDRLNDSMPWTEQLETRRGMSGERGRSHEYYPTYTLARSPSIGSPHPEPAYEHCMKRISAMPAMVNYIPSSVGAPHDSSRCIRQQLP